MFSVSFLFLSFLLIFPHTTNFIATPKLILNFPSGQIYSKHSSSFHVQKIAFKLYRFMTPFNILMTYYHVHYCYFVQKIVLCIHLTNVNIKYPWNIYYKPVNVLVYVVTTGIFIFPDLIQFSFFFSLISRNFCFQCKRMNLHEFCACILTTNSMLVISLDLSVVALVTPVVVHISSFVVIYSVTWLVACQSRV